MRKIELTPEMTSRRLAILLVDLIGSTAFVQRAGPLKAAKWLQYHDRLTRSLIYRYGGREIDRSDGFLVSFERPIDAVNFALAYQTKIPIKTRLGARIGIHYGEIVEVTQHELEVMGGAKPIELEGISKNIAARTMSLCQAGQVLLTQEAMQKIKGRTNAATPTGTRYALAGIYRFKGVREPQIIYMVGSSMDALTPPPSSEKAQRLGGPKRIKRRLRSMKIKELSWYVLSRIALIFILIALYKIGIWLSRDSARQVWNLDHPPWTWLGSLRYWIEYLIAQIEVLYE